MGNRERSRSTSRRLFVAAMVATAAACAVKSDPIPALTTATSSESEPTWTTRPALTTSWSKTADLVSDPVTRQKVDALEALSHEKIEIEGQTFLLINVRAKMTGIDGSSSPEWRAFEDLSSSISKADAKALLRHESPAIRAYFAEYISSTMQNESPDLLYPLFGDDTEVEMHVGCTGEPETIADIALGEILLDQTEVNLGREKYFENVLTDTRLKTKTRGLALSYLESIDPTVGRRLALIAATDSDAAWRREGIHALGSSVNASDVTIIGVEATSSTADDRYEAAKALGRIDSTEARDVLFPLLKDSDPSVRSAAAFAYSSQHSADSVVVNALLTDPDEGIAESARRAFDARSPREQH